MEFRAQTFEVRLNLSSFGQRHSECRTATDDRELLCLYTIIHGFNYEIPLRPSLKLPYIHVPLMIKWRGSCLGKRESRFTGFSVMKIIKFDILNIP